MFSKPRQRKETKDSKKRSKNVQSTKQTASSDECPNNLAFYWSIKTIKPNDGEDEILKVGSSKGSNIAKLWFPPNHPNQFRPLTAGKLYRWEMGESTACEDDERPGELFDVASIFFQSRQDNFVVTNLDCTRDDVAKATAGWGYLQFLHLGQGLSMVDFVGQHFRLAAPSGESTWMPEVVPKVYDYETRGPYAKKYVGPAGSLCGRLSLLIGMAAFSVAEEYAEETILECFGFGTWTPNGDETGIGRYEKRGAVVSIYLDPTAEGVTSKHLKALEKGRYGAIWGGNTLSPGLGESQSYTTASGFGGVDVAQTVPRGLSSAGPVSYTSYHPAATSGYVPATSAYSPSQFTGHEDDDIYEADD